MGRVRIERPGEQRGISVGECSGVQQQPAGELQQSFLRTAFALKPGSVVRSAQPQLLGAAVQLSVIPAVLLRAGFAVVFRAEP